MSKVEKISKNDNFFPLRQKRTKKKILQLFPLKQNYNRTGDKLKRKYI